MDIPHFAVDFESEYSDEVSVQNLGAYNYAWATHVFLVGIYAPGIQFVGPPAQAPWETINGCHWVSHNASFDETVYYVLKEKGVVPHGTSPSQWSCTADLSAYCLLGRSLKDAVKHGLDVEMSKALRQRVKNKRFSALKPEFQEGFKEYCLGDAKFCWQLWDKFSDQWPLEEQEFACIIRKRCQEGVCINQSKLQCQKSLLSAMRDQAAKELPWGEPYLALAQVANHCALVGIEPPESLAEDSPEAEAWEAKYGDTYPIIGQIRAYRKANIMLRRLEAMERRIMPSGRMLFSLKYHGAGATGRLAGADGLNIQNLNREPYQGVDLRRLLVAGEGQKFVIADFAQIEPRVTAWVTENTNLLSRLKEGVSFYEEDARAAGTWDGEPGTFKKLDPQGYQAQKAQSLGLAYGMGAERFCKAAKDQLQLTIEPEQAEIIKGQWHHRNPGVRRLWNILERDFKDSLFRKEPYVLSLPSGRSLRYMDIATLPDQRGLRYTAKNAHGPGWRYYWGGALFENLIQATARDILRDAVLACEREGICVRFTAHDELVCEVPINFDSQRIRTIMCNAPQWAHGLPLDAEVIESGEYLK